jgi:transcriptional regulator with XRE-family HTH domain
MMDTKNIFSQRLKELRKKKNYTQRDLAEKAAISFQAISTYEKEGNSSLPSGDALAHLAQALETSADYLLGLTDAETNDHDLRKTAEYLDMDVKTVETLLQFQDHTDGIEVTKGKIIDMMLRDHNFLLVIDRCCAALNHRKGFFQLSAGEEKMCYDEAVSFFIKVLNENFFDIDVSQSKLQNLSENGMLIYKKPKKLFETEKECNNGEK